ncbi:hypothetical protein DFH09DRAFT_1105801 [Mycena vulgaris]|nr:hypothetical protein DFH09DRAFT_1105801 [Mycena vulgaris]
MGMRRGMRARGCSARLRQYDAQDVSHTEGHAGRVGTRGGKERMHGWGMGRTETETKREMETETTARAQAGDADATRASMIAARSTDARPDADTAAGREQQRESRDDGPKEENQRQRRETTVHEIFAWYKVTKPEWMVVQFGGAQWCVMRNLRLQGQLTEFMNRNYPSPFGPRWIGTGPGVQFSALVAICCVPGVWQREESARRTKEGAYPAHGRTRTRHRGGRSRRIKETERTKSKGESARRTKERAHTRHPGGYKKNERVGGRAEEEKRKKRKEEGAGPAHRVGRARSWCTTPTPTLTRTTLRMKK